MKKLKKPTKTYVHEPTWDYHQVIEYIEQKYDLDARDYAGRHKQEKFDDSIPYLDFWHWLIDESFSGVHNGSFQYLPVKEYLEETSTPSWVKEILQKMYDEFQEDEMEFWVEW